LANLTSINGTSILGTGSQVAESFEAWFDTNPATCGTAASVPRALPAAVNGLPTVDASNRVKADLDTIKTQTVTCAAGVTVSPFVGNATAAIVVDASGNANADVKEWSNSTTTVSNLAIVFNTDFATNYDATNDRWSVVVPGQLTAAQIATGVWQDATAGDFTVASSIGKALYIANIAPGAAGGHFIAGSNAGTTTFGALTITGDFTISGTTFPNYFPAGGTFASMSINPSGQVAVGSIADNAITALSIAANAIGASELAADAVAEIQSGLATAAALASLVTTVGAAGAGLTEAGGTGDQLTDIPAAILDLAAGVETGLTLRQAMRLLLAAEAGKLSGAATTTITIRNAVADSKNRIVATVDADGNRSAVTYDLT
jgi:hypothetical protein